MISSFTVVLCGVPRGSVTRSFSSVCSWSYQVKEWSAFTAQRPCHCSPVTYRSVTASSRSTLQSSRLLRVMSSFELKLGWPVTDCTWIQTEVILLSAAPQFSLILCGTTVTSELSSTWTSRPILSASGSFVFASCAHLMLPHWWCCMHLGPRADAVHLTTVTICLLVYQLVSWFASSLLLKWLPGLYSSRSCISDCCLCIAALARHPKATDLQVVPVGVQVSMVWQ